MGTNFYARVNCCDKCNKPEYELHIGKASIGWTFSLRGYRNHWMADGKTELMLDTWLKWKTFLKSPSIKIYDEYDDIHSYKDFVEMVEWRQQNEKYNHARYILVPSSYPELKRGTYDYSPEYESKHWIDSEGYSFTDWEFC